MAAERSAPADAPPWEAQVMRLSLFLPSNVQATEEMWISMMGVPPETRNADRGTLPRVDFRER